MGEAKNRDQRGLVINGRPPPSKLKAMQAGLPEEIKARYGLNREGQPMIEFSKPIPHIVMTEDQCLAMIKALEENLAMAIRLRTTGKIEL